MTYAGAQTVYPCQEHEAVQVPIEKLLGADGKLNIYPEVSGKGFFDIDYREGRLVLKSTRYIGLIPISDDVAIHVTPRAPITNLMRMIERAGMKLTGIQRFIRGYEEIPGAVDSPEDVYVHAFTAALRPVIERGVLRRYVERRTGKEFRGRLLLGDTVSRFRSRGITDRTLFEVNDLTVNTPENKIIKYTTQRLLRHFVAQETTETRKVARDLALLLRPLTPVDASEVNAEFVARRAPSLIRGLPRSHQFYEPILWLSYLISTRSGIVMERIGRTRFETLVLDAASVFENYVRRLIEDATGTRFGGCSVFDGNVNNVPLFIDNHAVKTQPDYYFRHDARAVAVADAKYKPTLSSADRYELLAFCEALGVNAAAFIVPAYGGRDLRAYHGTTISGRRVEVIGIDLTAPDMVAEEGAFIARLGASLKLENN